MPEFVINPVSATDAATRGLRNEFAKTWQGRYTGVEDRLGGLMELGISSDKFEEAYGYFETAPYVRRREFGDAVPVENFRSRKYLVANHSWDISVQWNAEDSLFDQLKDLERAARQSGAHFATLAERVTIQMITGASDKKLLPTVPNAPDGAAIYATTAGGASRFGVTGGNVESGGGVATATAVRQDLFDALERFGQFQDTKGQPAMNPEVIDGNVDIWFNNQNQQIFREAFVQAFTHQVVSGDAAAVTNIILDSGMKLRLIPTQRITDNDWFLSLRDFDLKPLFEQVAMPLEERVMTQENSDVSRFLKIEGIFWQTIRGFGTNLPLGTVKVNN